MDTAMLSLQQHDGPKKMTDFRRSVRRVVRILTTVADQSRFATGVVTNISEGGCELRAVSCDWSPIPFFPNQYLTLRLYPLGGPAALRITLAEIRWVKGELAGVEFVSLSQGDETNLHRLFREQVTLGSDDKIATMPREFLSH